jgi:bacterioferritin (cytochrome b1)
MPDDPIPDPMYAEPADGGTIGGDGMIGDDGLLAILESAIADERAAQEKYRRGLDRCADAEACRMFEQLLREEEAHERALSHRYAEVKKRIGLSGAGRGA